MQIKTIEIKNIRNISHEIFTFQKNNIIVGKNAKGKTTIAECIYFCCFYKSFRTSKSEEMITFGKKKASIILKYEDKQKENKIQINFFENKKRFYFNDQEVTNLYEVINKIKCVLITPSNIDLIEDSPQKRRKYLNILLSQYDPKYLLVLIGYNKLLKIKNSMYAKYYKDNEIDQTYLKIINDKMLEYNKIIVQNRIDILNKIEVEINKILCEITGGKEQVKIKYNVKSSSKSHEDIYENELKQKKILSGNHLDDIIFYLNDKNAKVFASQGQKRLITLCFFLSQANLDESDFITIFDDVSIDLDQQRQQKLIKYLIGTNQNIYISTDILKLIIPSNEQKNLNIINMK